MGERTDAEHNQLIIKAVYAGIAEDWRLAADLLEEAMLPEVRDGFVCACGFANVVARAATRASHPDAEGPLVCEVELVPLSGSGATKMAEAAEEATAIGAIVAAVGNGDYDGAAEVFQAIDDQDRQCQVVLSLFVIAVDVAKAEAQAESA